MNSIQVSEAQVKNLAESKITQTCAEHGVQRGDLKDTVIADAYDWAKEKLTADAERDADPNYQLRESLREENRILKMQIEALKSGRGTTSGPTNSTVMDADMMAQKFGPAVWNHQLNGDGRLQSCGIDPALNTAGFRAEIKEYFGPGSSSMKASELARSNHARYKLLKTAGKCLRLI
jgi:hypothetical protein